MEGPIEEAGARNIAQLKFELTNNGSTSAACWDLARATAGCQIAGALLLRLALTSKQWQGLKEGDRASITFGVRVPTGSKTHLFTPAGRLDCVSSNLCKLELHKVLHRDNLRSPSHAELHFFAADSIYVNSSETRSSACPLLEHNILLLVEERALECQRPLSHVVRVLPPCNEGPWQPDERAIQAATDKHLSCPDDNVFIATYSANGAEHADNAGLCLPGKQLDLMKRADLIYAGDMGTLPAAAHIFDSQRPSNQASAADGSILQSAISCPSATSSQVAYSSDKTDDDQAARAIRSLVPTDDVQDAVQELTTYVFSDRGLMDGWLFDEAVHVDSKTLTVEGDTPCGYDLVPVWDDQSNLHDDVGMGEQPSWTLLEVTGAGIPVPTLTIPLRRRLRIDGGEQVFDALRPCSDAALRAHNRRVMPEGDWFCSAGCQAEGKRAELQERRSPECSPERLFALQALLAPGQGDVVLRQGIMQNPFSLGVGMLQAPMTVPVPENPQQPYFLGNVVLPHLRGMLAGMTQQLPQSPHNVVVFLSAHGVVGQLPSVCLGPGQPVRLLTLVPHLLTVLREQMPGCRLWLEILCCWVADNELSTELATILGGFLRPGEAIVVSADSGTITLPIIICDRPASIAAFFHHQSATVRELLSGIGGSGFRQVHSTCIDHTGKMSHHRIGHVETDMVKASRWSRAIEVIGDVTPTAASDVNIVIDCMHPGQLSSQPLTASPALALGPISEHLHDLEEILAELTVERGANGSTDDWVAAVQQQGRALAAELLALQEEAAASSAKLAALQREREQERSQLADTQAALKEAMEHLESTCSEGCTAEELHAELQMQTAALERLRKDIAAAEACKTQELQQTIARFEELEAALALAEQQMETAQDLSLIEHLEEKYRALKAEMQHSMDAAGQSRKEATDAEAARAQALAELEQAKQLTAALQGKLSEQTKERDRLARQLEQDQATASSSEQGADERLAELLQQLQGKEAALALLRQEADRARMQAEQQQQEADRLQRKCRDLEETLCQWQAGTTSDEAALRRDLAGASARALRLQQEVHDLEQQLRQANTSVSGLQQQLQQLEHQQAAAAADAKASQQRAAALEQEQGEASCALDAEVAAVQQHIQERDQHMLELQDQLQELRGRGEQDAEHKEELGPSLKELQAVKAENTAALKRASAELVTLRASAEAKQDQLDKLQEELDSTRSALKRTQQDGAAQAAARAADLESEFEKACLSARQQQERIDSLQQQVQDLTQRAASAKQLQVELERVQAENVAKAQYLKEAAAKLQAARESEKQKAAELANASEVAQILTSEVQQLQVEVELKSEAVEGWRGEARQARALADSAAEAIEEATEFARQVGRLQEALDEHAATLQRQSGILQQKEQQLQQKDAALAERTRALEAATAAQQGMASELQRLRGLTEQLQQQLKEAQQGAPASDASLENVRRQAAAEAVEARNLLAKAESATIALGKQMAALKVTTAAEKQESESAANQDMISQEDALALLDEMEELTEQLDEEAAAAEEARSRAEAAEAELARLQGELAHMKGEENGASPSNASGSSKDASLVAQLAAARAAQAAAEAEAAELRSQLSTSDTRDATARQRFLDDLRRMSGTKRLTATLQRVAELEQENAILQESMSEREQKLKQSRRFINTYLQHASTINPDQLLSSVPADPDLTGQVGP
ncbi:hypothetical protein WJX72_011684 [[Myrmecia] bisecta]|uniref:Uncharacterized protein n=1 Tax=[Myrmecia] bisecta TaxID=41462 RepID=A0AAW1PA32_9CHLO